MSTNDVASAQNQGALYYGEETTIAPDDAAYGNQMNNASYRRTSFPGGSPNFSINSFIGSTVREQAAINAWAVNDPAVVLVSVFVPDDGRFILGYRVTDLSGSGSGPWHYEYALYNQNSHRAGASFSVPVNCWTTLSNIGFHDVSYHSGDGVVYPINYDGTDWPAARNESSLMWLTQTEDVDVNANALRWATLYNFRFDANTPPTDGTIAIGLYRGGKSNSVTATVSAGVPSPVAVTCTRGDVNLDGAIDGWDIQRFSEIAADSSGTPSERCAGDLESSPDCRIDFDDVPYFANVLLSHE